MNWARWRRPAIVVLAAAATAALFVLVMRVGESDPHGPEAAAAPPTGAAAPSSLTTPPSVTTPGGPVTAPPANSTTPPSTTAAAPPPPEPKASVEGDLAAAMAGAAPALGPSRPVTIAFGGDVHFEGFLRTALLADPEHVLDPVAAELGAADLAMVNLETTVTERGTPEDKAFTFRAPEEAFKALQAAGVDVVELANNHSHDFGEIGLTDTIEAAQRAGMAFVGVGRDLTEALTPARFEVAGRSISFFGGSHVIDAYARDLWPATADRPGMVSVYDRERPALVEAVRAEAERADTVVVFLHWGTETFTCPNERQLVVARELVDAGADIVVGSHAHRLLGGGRLDGAVVHYGLGNFVFYRTSGPATDSGIFEVTIAPDDSTTYRWIPARLRNGVATPLEGEEGERAEQDWDSLRDCTDLQP